MTAPDRFTDDELHDLLTRVFTELRAPGDLQPEDHKVITTAIAARNENERRRLQARYDRLDALCAQLLAARGALVDWTVDYSVSYARLDERLRTKLERLFAVRT